MGGRQGRLGALVIAGLLAAPAGCGDSGGSDDGTTEAAATPSIPAQDRTLTEGFAGVEREAVATAQSYVVSFGSGEEETVCKLTSLDASALKDCRALLAELGPSRQPPFEVAVVKVKGDSATVLLRPTGSFGDPTQFKLRRVGGEWKVIVVSVPQ